jgi:acyl-coenzyme A thioesterase PaaI-like protein
MPIAPSVVTELGLRVTERDDRTLGRARIFPELCAPGTTAVRTSVLAIWADIVTGLTAAAACPRIPVTSDLQVQVYRPATVGMDLVVEATTVKLGRTRSVFDARFVDADTGTAIADAYLSFVESADPAHVSDDLARGRVPAVRNLLAIDLADRVSRRVVAPGTVEIPRSSDALNLIGAIQGGVVALGAEEAALSLASQPEIAVSMVIHYLRPFAVGQARCVAEGAGKAFVVRMTDDQTGKLGAVATIRTVAAESFAK